MTPPYQPPSVSMYQPLVLSPRCSTESDDSTRVCERGPCVSESLSATGEEIDYGAQTPDIACKDCPDETLVVQQFRSSRRASAPSFLKPFQRLMRKRPELSIPRDLASITTTHAQRGSYTSDAPQKDRSAANQYYSKLLHGISNPFKETMMKDLVEYLSDSTPICGDMEDFCKMAMCIIYILRNSRHEKDRERAVDALETYLKDLIDTKFPDPILILWWLMADVEVHWVMVTKQMHLSSNKHQVD